MEFLGKTPPATLTRPSCENRSEGCHRGAARQRRREKAMLAVLVASAAYQPTSMLRPICTPVRPPSMLAKSNQRPVCLELPKGVESVDALNAELLRGFDASALQAATENLEVAIFDSPPFDKPNECARRRNLALAYWLQDDPAVYPQLIPNAKEVLRQQKGNDAEMQYILGVSMLSCMESEGSRVDAVRCLQRAIDLKPDYLEAIQALSVTEGKASSEPPPPTSDDSAPVVEATSDEPKPTGERNDPGDGFGAAPVGYVWGGLF